MADERRRADDARESSHVDSSEPGRAGIDAAGCRAWNQSPRRGASSRVPVPEPCAGDRAGIVSGVRRRHVDHPLIREWHTL